jgi:bacteriocin biosynthesis cyclodehydratase domain-containing protein
MTPNTERRTPNVEDHEARRVDAADAVGHEGPVRDVPTVLTAPRCGQDRERPRLKSTIEIVGDGDRLVLLRGGHRDGDVALDGDPRVLVELLTLLDGTRGPAEILDALRASVAPALEAGDLGEALEALTADGLIEDATDDARHLDAAGLERYDRQLRYFGDLAGAGVPRAAAQARLEAATVAVLGLGGLGGMAATMLTVCGVGTIVGVDHDVVELSNLARQVLYGQDDLGRLKVEAAANRLSQLNARSHFRGIAQRLDSNAAVADAIAGADFVVAAVDWPADRISGWVNDACWAAGIPYVGMSQHPPLVRVGPTYLPGATGCLTCQEAAYRRRFPLFDAARAAISNDSPAATYAPACGLIGSLVANEAIAHITGFAPVACLGRSTVIDLTTLEVTHEQVPRDPDCRICGRDGVSTMRPGA